MVKILHSYSIPEFRGGPGGGRRGGPGGGPGRKDGLKGPFEACEDLDDLDDLDCGDDLKAMVFPEATCRDLAVGDEFPSFSEIRENNPCADAAVC